MLKSHDWAMSGRAPGIAPGGSALTSVTPPPAVHHSKGLARKMHVVLGWPLSEACLRATGGPHVTDVDE